MEVYVVYAKQCNSKMERFVCKIFALEENAEKFVEEWESDNL